MFCAFMGNYGIPMCKTGNCPIFQKFGFEANNVGLVRVLSSKDGRWFWIEILIMTQ